MKTKVLRLINFELYLSDVFTVQRETSNDASGLDHQQYPEMAIKRRYGTQELLSKTLNRRIGMSKEE